MKINIPAIIRAVSKDQNVTMKSILSKSRKARTAKARAAVMALMRRSGMTFEEIGNWLDRDHSTVMHGCQRAAGWPLDGIAALVGIRDVPVRKYRARGIWEGKSA